MKNVLLCSTMLLFLGTVASPLGAQPRLHISIPLPPPLHLPAPPSLVILPETRVYAVPELQEELFFYGGWWWRPWSGRWYRSRHHDRGWVHYGSVPSFYRGIPPGWRDDYRHRRWGSGAWNHRPIHHDELQRNWRTWDSTRHWDRPEYRQHESRRDGRPFTVREIPGRRPAPGRPEAIHPGREPRRPEAIQRAPGNPSSVDRGHENRGAREPRRPERQQPVQSRPEPGGRDHRPEPKRDRH